MSDIKIEYRSIDQLIPYARNSRTHSDAQVAQIAASIKEFGFTNPVLIDPEASIIAGHGRVLAARKLNMTSVPCIELGYLTEAQKKAYVIADNKLALNAGWDEEMLRLELAELKNLDFDTEITGFELDELEELITNDSDNTNTSKGNLADKFLIPPFSVLNAREGWWQNRKKLWLDLGIESENGRNAPAGGSPDLLARQQGETGTSVFDAVLCELIYLWFSNKNGIIFDPFAGGSVRGIVASKLDRNYIGHELRKEQVDANIEQAKFICHDSKTYPKWICGDSRNLDKTCKDLQADLIFSCPPYADLEIYSDDPKDLSNLEYNDFKKAYFEIIKKSCDKLKNNRFACFVVGEVRDKNGNYYNFVGDTIKAFQEAGLHYYNEAILITPCGSVAMRAGKTFTVSRKLGKAHQNVLIFVKGNAKEATLNCGTIDLDENWLQSLIESENNSL